MLPASAQPMQAWSFVLLVAAWEASATGAQKRSASLGLSASSGLWSQQTRELQPGPLWGVPPPMSGPLPMQGPWTYASRWKRWPEETADDEPDVYRPWRKRFDQMPGNPKAEKPEFRKGYQNFESSYPHHAITPNSADRNAESTTILVFVFAALGTVLGAGLTLERFQGAAHPEKQLMALGVSLSLPWLLAMGWLVQIALQHFSHPARGPEGQHWKCDAAVWYLLLAPIVTALTITSHVLWLCGVNDKTEVQVPMGRMMPSMSAVPWGSTAGKIKVAQGLDEKGSERLLRALASQPSRLLLLFLEVVSTVIAILLSIYNEPFCEPEIWWAVFGLAMATSLVLLIAPAVLGLGYLASRAFGDFNSTGREVQDGHEISAAASGGQLSATSMPAPMPGATPPPMSEPLSARMPASNFPDLTPGQYVVTNNMVAVTTGVASSSPILGPLLAGTRINILEVVHQNDEQRVRGRIDNPPGWISLLDMVDGRSWARKVE